MGSFKGVFIPVIFIILLSLISLTYLVVSTANDSDSKSYEAEKRILRTNIKERGNSLAIMAEDNGWWTLAYENIVEKVDTGWIADNIDGLAFGLDGTIILDEKNSEIYSQLNPGLPEASLFLDDDLVTKINSIFVNDLNTPHIFSAIIGIENRFFLLGISVVQKSTLKEIIQIKPERRPIMIFIDELAEKDVVSLGKSIMLEDLELTTGSERAIKGGDKGYIALDNNLHENVFGRTDQLYFSWKRHLPGSRMLDNITSSAIIILIILIVAFVVFIRNALKIINNLNVSNHAKSDFLANMSHELRTPLNAIMGFTEMIKSEMFGKIEGKENKEYLDIIHSSSHDLLSLINDILDLSKVEAGQLKVFKEKLNINSELTYCITTLQQLIKNEKLSLIFDLKDLEINSDIKLFHQTVINIISNAIKFTPENGTITIKSIIENGYAKIVISDTGIGMDEEELAIALTQFGQVQSSYTRSHTGTGLGLPLVNKIMKELGGYMEIFSTKGQGTTTSLFFPVR